MNKGQGKGPRPKHVPQRSCIACKRSDAKRGLLRLVRSADGRVEPDPSGKRAGRGAYLCGTRSCWERAIKRQSIGRALRVELHPDDHAALLAFGQGLPEETPAESANEE